MMRDRLARGLEAMGIPADKTALDRFEMFHVLLDEGNRKMDLTAVMEEDERVDRHDLDSAAPLAKGLLPEGARIIDVGTGAGFPGIPLLILRPDLKLTLLDAQAKRIHFLEGVLAQLGLTAVTFHARAEDAARLPEHREAYDAAVSRAVAPSPVLQELTLPFVRVGGKAIAWKGPGAEGEWERAKRAAFVLGGALRPPEPAPVPGRPEWNHVLLISEKERPTPKAYPRKAGTPSKKPLA